MDRRKGNRDPFGWISRSITYILRYPIISIMNTDEKNKKSICIVRHYYFPGCTRIIKEIRALRGAGYAVDIICLRRPGQKYRETIDGVQVYRIPQQHQRSSLVRYLFEYGLSFIIMAVMVTVLYFRRRYFCIQVNTLPDALVFITLIPRLLGAKILLDMHEPTPELWITKYGSIPHPTILKIHVCIEQWAIKFANAVITVNNTIRQLYIERGANGQKIAVIRNVPAEELNINARLQSSHDGFILLTHGAIEERYGHEVIIRALPFLRDKIDSLHLYIVGEGESLEKIKRLSENLGCSDLITFTGFVQFSQIADFIERADIGLVTLQSSPFAELCQPNKLFEYIALKKPVVIPRFKAIEEIFDDSCVMFFEPGNHKDLARCILELYNHPERGKKLAMSVYRRYEKIRWSETKKIYLKIVESLNSKNKS